MVLHGMTACCAPHLFASIQSIESRSAGAQWSREQCCVDCRVAALSTASLVTWVRKCSSLLSVLCISCLLAFSDQQKTSWERVLAGWLPYWPISEIEWYTQTSLTAPVHWSAELWGPCPKTISPFLNESVPWTAALALIMCIIDQTMHEDTVIGF